MSLDTLTDVERNILLSFILEHGKELDKTDSVEEVLASAFDKLANVLRRSSAW